MHGTTNIKFTLNIVFLTDGSTYVVEELPGFVVIRTFTTEFT